MAPIYIYARPTPGIPYDQCGPDGPAPCPQCSEVFPDWDAMDAHRLSMMLARNGHVHCVMCQEGFYNPSVIPGHMKQYHPAKQDLKCPNCDGIYWTMSSLMMHIQMNMCPGLTKEMINRNRIKKLTWAGKIENLAVTGYNEVAPVKPVVDVPFVPVKPDEDKPRQATCEPVAEGSDLPLPHNNIAVGRTSPDSSATPLNGDTLQAHNKTQTTSPDGAKQASATTSPKSDGKSGPVASSPKLTPVQLASMWMSQIPREEIARACQIETPQDPQREASSSSSDITVAELCAAMDINTPEDQECENPCEAVWANEEKMVDEQDPLVMHECPVKERPWRPVIDGWRINPVYFTAEMFGATRSKDDGGEDLIFEGPSIADKPWAGGWLLDHPHCDRILKAAVEHRSATTSGWAFPNNAQFRANKYWVPALNRWLCPHRECPRAYKDYEAFQDHIHNAHATLKKLYCPDCWRDFPSDIELLRHAEGFSKRCTVKARKGYRSFIDQLTGGLIDVTGCNQYGELMYTVPREAILLFGSDKNKAIAQAEVNGENEAGELDPW